MVRDKKARRSNGANGKSTVNGEIIVNGKKPIEPENEVNRPLGERPKDPTTPKQEKKTKQQKGKGGGGGGGSQCVLLTQGIMANDNAKIDSVIRNFNNEVINATLRDLQPMQVLPLLKILEDRLKTRKAAEIRPTIRWAQVTFSVHMPYLISLPNLEKEVGGLIGWLRARVGHHRELLALHGKISTIADLIKRRANSQQQKVAPQPLVVFNNDLDSDSEDFDAIASDEDGESSEDDWWEDGELKEENQEEDDEEDDDDDEGSDDGSDDDAMDADSGSGSEDGSDNEEEEDMEVG